MNEQGNSNGSLSANGTGLMIGGGGNEAGGGGEQLHISLDCYARKLNGKLFEGPLLRPTTKDHHDHHPTFT